MCADGPIHIASDSKAFISRARTHVQAIKHGHCQPKWHSHTDGDLWMQLWQIVAIKGPRSVRFTKVKGHATTKDLQHGISTVEDKAGNDLADGLATKAYKEADHAVGHLASFYCDRQKRYISLVHCIHSFVLQMLQAANEARANMHTASTVTARQGQPTVAIATALQYGNNGTTLGTHGMDASVHHAMDEGAKRILYMLRQYTWSLAPETKPGVSWLELCALFFLHGGTH